MSDLSWRVRQWIRKLLPITVIGALLYGGYSFYRQGIFRRGVGPALSSMLHKLPYFGSRFKRYSATPAIAAPRSYSYAHSGHSPRHHGHGHGHKSRGHRRHGRHHKKHHR